MKARDRNFNVGSTAEGTRALNEVAPEDLADKRDDAMDDTRDVAEDASDKAEKFRTDSDQASTTAASTD